MSLPVILRPDARADYDTSFDWYEARKSGAGAAFAARVQATLKRIGATPAMHAIVFQGVRKAPVRKYPFRVYYRERGDHIEVLSVFHTSRDPSDWQSRV